MKRILLIIIFVFSLINANAVIAQTPEITNGLSYLTATQNLDGSWDSEVPLKN